jgi:hypothetical protein
VLDCNCVTLKLFLKELNNVNFVKMCVMQLRALMCWKRLLSNYCLKGIKMALCWFYSWWNCKLFNWVTNYKLKYKKNHVNSKIIFLGFDSRNRHWVDSNCFMVCALLCLLFIKCIARKTRLIMSCMMGN